MKLERFKAKDKKKLGIILFTITCILLISGVILYRTFAIFETNDHFNVINGTIEDEGNIRFMVYVDNVLQKNVPNKESGYSLDTSTSYCENGELVSWDNENWEVKIKGVSTTKTKCYLYFKEIYKESILNGAIPDLGNGRLIPVTISNEEKPSDVSYTGSNVGGKVYKADITNQESPWYSYQNKQWANAVILKDGVVDNYKSGDEIEEKAIESYFVWIPRYRYQLKDNEESYNFYTDISYEYGAQPNNNVIPNIGATNPYKIVFENKNVGLSTGTQKDSWLTHPAFLSFNSNGMWVGKFKTGTTIADDNYNVINSSAVQVKPNVHSWKGIDVSHAFYTSYNYLRDLESHMMKNSEWGAVFYLTYSEYGRCNKENCENVRINNNENNITGFSANFEPTCGLTVTNIDCNNFDSVEFNQDGPYGWSYYNSQSRVASTTGNYFGIYDMNGGMWEYVMGVMQSSANSGIPATGPNATNNSGFNGPYSDDTGTYENGLPWPSSKYYDLYDFGTLSQQYQRGHLGDATKEIGPFYSIQYLSNQDLSNFRYINSWFANCSWFIYSEYPWFIRGGDSLSGSESGLGAFGRQQGIATYFAFRIVLSL